LESERKKKRIEKEEKIEEGKPCVKKGVWRISGEEKGKKLLIWGEKDGGEGRMRKARTGGHRKKRPQKRRILR